MSEDLQKSPKKLKRTPPDESVSFIKTLHEVDRLKKNLFLAKSSIVTHKEKSKKLYANYFKEKKRLFDFIDNTKDEKALYDLLKTYKEVDESQIFYQKNDD